MLTTFVAKRDKPFLFPKAIISYVCSHRYSYEVYEKSLVVHVGAGIDTLLGEFGQRDLETILNGLQDSLVFRAADEGDTETLCSKTTGTTNTVEV